MTQSAAAKRSVGREIVGLVFHALMAMVGGVCIGLLLGVFIFDPLVAALGLHLNRWPGIGLYNPIFWLVSAFLGILVNRLTRHRSASWVAAVGVCYLLWSLHLYVPGLHTLDYNGVKVYYQGPTGWPSVVRALHMLFSPTCKDGQCLEQMFVTLPFLSSIAYSFGAWLALRFEPTRKPQEQTPEGSHRQLLPF
jgi:hypothetical protein